MSWYATSLPAAEYSNTYLQIGGARLFKVNSDTTAATLDFLSLFGNTRYN